MKLKTKIMLLGPIAVLGMALVASIFIIGTRIESTQRAKLSHDQTVRDLIAAIEIDFLQVRRSEKDFLLREDEKYVARHDEVEARIETNLSELQEILNASFDGAMSNEMASLKGSVGLYARKFEELVAAKRELGLDEKSGLQGSLRASVHNAEEELKKIGNAELTVKMLMMRRHEKDFIMRVADKYLASLAERVAEFKAYPDSTFGGTSAKEDIVAFIDAYQADFEKFAQATINERQLRTELSAAFADAEPSFEAIKTFATETAAAVAASIEEAQKTRLQIVIVCLIAAFAAISLIAYLIARSISNPLTYTVGALQALAQGDHRVEVNGEDRNDEIGEMARAILVFRNAARDKERMEREAEENRSLSDRERSQREAAKAAEAKTLNAAIEALASGLVRLSEGDLTVSLDTPLEGGLDRLRIDFNMSVQKLAEALSEVKGTIGNIHGNAGEMRSAVEDLSKRTEQQAASLEETSAALEQITSTVKSSSDRAQDASRKAAEANAATEASTEVVAKAVGAMNRIESASVEIAKIIGVIDEIAFQTNLLALNAGVEAARAGDAGKGFAVVAQEVRELAQRSATAAKEIKDLIGKSGVEVNNGVELVKATGEALSKIAVHVVDINDHIESIATAAREQATGLQEVNVAVSQMDQVTQQNAAMVEETNAVTHRLAGDADHLSQLVIRFTTSTRADASKPTLAVSPGNPAAGGSDSPARTILTRVKQAFVGTAAASGDQAWSEF